MRSLRFTLVFMAIQTLTFAAKPAGDIPVTTDIASADANLVPYYMQSDGGGPYQNGVDGVVSVLVANGYNGITWGDWRVDLLANQSSRSLGISFCDPAHGTACAPNAVQPGDPGYTAPANPPWWGTDWQAVRWQTTCSFENHDMHTMHPGDAFTCTAWLRMPTVANVYYGLVMGSTNLQNPMPETQDVQVTCNAADAMGCSDWYLDPIPIVNADGTTSPGRTRARLVQYVTNNHGSIQSQTNEGDFYFTYHLHVTRP